MTLKGQLQSSTSVLDLRSKSNLYRSQYSLYVLTVTKFKILSVLLKVVQQVLSADVIKVLLQASTEEERCIWSYIR